MQARGAGRFSQAVIFTGQFYMPGTWKYWVMGGVPGASSTMFPLKQQHAVAVRVEAVASGNGVLVGGEGEFAAGEGAD